MTAIFHNKADVPAPSRPWGVLLLNREHLREYVRFMNGDYMLEPRVDQIWSAAASYTGGGLKPQLWFKTKAEAQAAQLLIAARTGSTDIYIRYW